MGMSISELFVAGTLLLNSVVILNEKRFLRRYGLSSSQQVQGYGGQDESIKGRIIGLIAATQTVMKYPLVAVNFLVIILLVIAG
eukprot:Clim_evm57s232 gene=Clim_evmTU57s232